MKKRQKKNGLKVVLVSGILFLASIACNYSGLKGVAEPTLTPQLVITPLSLQAVVVSDSAPLRSGPGIDYAQAGALSRDQVVNVKGVTVRNDWYLIGIPGYQPVPSQIWVSSELIAVVTPSVQPTNTSTPFVSYMDTQTAPTITPTLIPPSGTPTPTITPPASAPKHATPTWQPPATQKPANPQPVYTQTQAPLNPTETTASIQPTEQPVATEPVATEAPTLQPSVTQEPPTQIPITPPTNTPQSSTQVPPTDFPSMPTQISIEQPTNTLPASTQIP